MSYSVTGTGGPVGDSVFLEENNKELFQSRQEALPRQVAFTSNSDQRRETQGFGNLIPVPTA